MGVIKQAAIDNFYTFELFDNSKGSKDIKFLKVIKNLRDSNLLINSFNEDKGVDFQVSFLEEIERRKKLKNANSLTSLMKEELISVPGDEFTFIGFDNDPLITKEEKDIDILGYSQERAQHHYVNMLSGEEKYTGVDLLSTKYKFLLFPIRIKDHESNVSYVDIHMTLYQHGYGILNSSFRAGNIDTNKFSKKIWDIDIDKAYLPRFMFGEETNKYEYKKIGGCKTLDQALERYIQFLQKSVTNHKSNTYKFDSMTIFDMENLPDNFLNNKGTFNVDMCSLLFAPRNSSDLTNKIAQEELNNYSKTIGTKSKILINSKRFIMVHGKDMYREKLQKYPEDFQQEIVYSGFRTDMIFALEKLFLRNITSRKFLDKMAKKDISVSEMYKILKNRDYEMRFETDQVFYNYSTTREYIDFFLDKGIESSIAQIIDDTVGRAKDLALLRRENRTHQITVIGTILTILFASLFSLSGLSDAYEVLSTEGNETIIVLYLIIIFLTIIGVVFLYKESTIIRPFNVIKDSIEFKWLKYRIDKKNRKISE